MRCLFSLCTHLALHRWYFRCLKGGREASARLLNISFISYLKMANPGQVKDHLNWSFKSNIFVHTLRVPFPVMWVRWERFTTFWLYQSREGEQHIEQSWDLAAELPVQSKFSGVLLLICVFFIWKKKLYKPDQKFADTNRSLQNTDSYIVTSIFSH